MQYEYKTHGVCASKILLDVDGGVVKSVRFIGGCNGNTQGVAKLVEGMSVDEVITRLKGIRCGMKQTSCPDQLAEALSEIKRK